MVSQKVESYQDLVVWQKAHELVIDLYKLKLSKKESESLATKAREAAMAIASNIAIGFKKRGKKPKLHYYRAALTAIQELEYYLLVAHDLGLVKNYTALEDEMGSIERMIIRLIRSNSPTERS